MGRDAGEPSSTVDADDGPPKLGEAPPKSVQDRLFEAASWVVLFAGLIVGFVVFVGGIHAGVLWAHRSGAGFVGVVIGGVVGAVIGFVIAVLLFALVSVVVPADDADLGRWERLKLGFLSERSIPVAVVAGFGWWVFSSLQGGVQTVVALLRTPSSPGFTFADLAGNADEAVATWLRAPSAKPGDGLASAVDLFFWHTLFELAVITCSSLVFVALLVWLSNQLGPQPVGTIAMTAVAGIGLLAMIEVLNLIVRAVFLNGEWVSQCAVAAPTVPGCAEAPPDSWLWNGFAEVFWNAVSIGNGAARPLIIVFIVVLPIAFGVGALLQRPIGDGNDLTRSTNGTERELTRDANVQRPPIKAILRPIRAQLVALIVLAVTAVLPLQSPDVFLRLRDSWVSYACALAASAIFGGVLFTNTYAGYSSACSEDGSEREPLPRPTLAIVGAAMVAAGLAAIAGDLSDAFGVAVGALVWLTAGIVLFVVFRRLVVLHPGGPWRRPAAALDRLPYAVSIVVIVLAATGLAAGFSLLPIAGWGWAVGGGLLLLVTGVSAQLDPSDGEARKREPDPVPTTLLRERIKRWVAPGMAAAPAGICGLAMLQWSVPEAIFTSGPTAVDLLVVQGLGFLALAGVIFAIARSQARPVDHVAGRTRADGNDKTGTATIWLWKSIVAAGLVGAVLVMVRPVGTAPRLGSLAVIMLFLSGVVAVVTFLLRRTDRRPAPYAVHLLGFKQPPVLLALVLWAAAASVIAVAVGANDAHQVRASIEADTTDIAGCGSGLVADTPEGLFDRWLVRNGLTAMDDIGPEPGAVGEPGERPVVPVVMVAGSGGGIRAAYWTAATMEEIFGHEALASDAPCPTVVDREPTPDRLLFASGISGSSLGLAAWASVVADGGPEVEETWPEHALGDDYISAQLAWGLLVELPRLWLRFDMGADRAEMLERSWEESWDATWSGGATLTSGHLSAAHRPIEPQLVLGGAVAQDGCWLIVGPLDISPTSTASRCYAEEADGRGGVAGSYSVASFTCDQTDLRRSTAALLSARFPFVSPAGTVAQCDDGPVDEDLPERIQIIDGGYIDSSASDLLGRTWRVVAPLVDKYNRNQTAVCLVPMVVQLDNGFIAPAPPSSPRVLGQPSVVLNGVLQARESINQRARHETVLDFGLYERIVPRAQPGVSPSLGWALSEATIDRMNEEIKGTGGSADNPATQRSIEAVRQLIIDPGTTNC